MGEEEEKKNFYLIWKIGEKKTSQTVNGIITASINHFVKCMVYAEKNWFHFHVEEVLKTDLLAVN